MCPEQNFSQLSSKKNHRTTKNRCSHLSPSQHAHSAYLLHVHCSSRAQIQVHSLQIHFTFWPLISNAVTFFFFMQEHFCFLQTTAYSPPILSNSSHIFPIHLYPIPCTSLSIVFMLFTWVLISDCLSSVQTQYPALKKASVTGFLKSQPTKKQSLAQQQVYSLIT